MVTGLLPVVGVTLPLFSAGGSSALTPLRHALQAAFAGTPLVEGDLFGGVAAGLVYRAVR